MGGYGSGRRPVAMPTTDGVTALDVRLLARSGRLAPGAHAFRWPSVWGDAGIAFTVDDDGDGLTLDYRIRDSLWDDPRPVRQAVRLERTPCRFGGERPWFRCPRCDRRVALLSLWGDAFRCRACHGLAYGNTREAGWERARRRSAKVRARLGDNEGRWWLWLPKPKGMRWRTYERLVAELRAAEAATEAGLAAQFEALIARFDGKYGVP